MILDTEAAQQRLLSLLGCSPHTSFLLQSNQPYALFHFSPRTLLGVKYAYSHICGSGIPVRPCVHTTFPAHSCGISGSGSGSGFSGSGSGSGFSGSGSGSGFSGSGFSLSGFISSSGGIITSSRGSSLSHPSRKTDKETIERTRIKSKSIEMSGL